MGSSGFFQRAAEWAEEQRNVVILELVQRANKKGRSKAALMNSPLLMS
jgi:hypothetical protein